MSYLTLDADRLVRDAVDAYLEGRMRADSGGDCVYATRNSQYRVVEGLVQEASDTSLMGAELVGWLVEELGQPLIEPRWRPYGRAIFVERRSRHVVVTSRTLTRNAVSGNVPPIPKLRRIPSVIPPSPPIPVLKSSNPPPPPDGSPTPFRFPDIMREAALTIDAHDSVVPDELPPPSVNERPTRRPPASDEATVARDRSSYEDLLEASRTPTWSGERLAARPSPIFRDKDDPPPPSSRRPVEPPPSSRRPIEPPPSSRRPDEAPPSSRRDEPPPSSRRPDDGLPKPPLAPPPAPTRPVQLPRPANSPAQGDGVSGALRAPSSEGPGNVARRFTPDGVNSPNPPPTTPGMAMPPPPEAFRDEDDDGILEIELEADEEDEEDEHTEH